MKSVPCASFFCVFCSWAKNITDVIFCNFCLKKKQDTKNIGGRRWPRGGRRGGQRSAADIKMAILWKAATSKMVQRLFNSLAYSEHMCIRRDLASRAGCCAIVTSILNGC